MILNCISVVSRFSSLVLRGLFTSSRGLSPTSRSLFRSSRGLFTSSHSLFRSSRGLFRSSRSLFTSSSGLFTSSRGLFRSSCGLSPTSSGLFTSSRGLSAGSSAVPIISTVHKLLALSLFAITLNGYAADPSADQALQQLRILQRQLAPGSTGNNAPGNRAPNPVTIGLDPNSNLAVIPSTNVPAPSQSVASTSTTTSTTTNNTTVTVPSTPNTIPPANPTADAVDEEAFKHVKEQLFPLKPEQIIELKRKQQTTEYVEASTPGTPPKPTATSQFVNLSPGATPPVIRLSQGFVSSLVFLDSTGAPWPISAYDLGDPSSFNIQWDKSSNTLMIQATKLYNYGNLAVRLVGLNTPVMLTLIPGQKAVDYRVDLRVQGLGPNASHLPLEQGLPPSANAVLLHVLEGVPPPGSKRLIVSGGDARGWMFADKMYIRTNLTILSPGWIGSMTSADGMHAYEMQKAPVLLVSWHGKVMQLKIEGL